tara:strand:- start:579 stop:1217 length:639 start_codon:yes stop_codon:yes gene_type:complete
MNIYVIETKKNKEGAQTPYEYHDELRLRYKKHIGLHNDKLEEQERYFKEGLNPSSSTVNYADSGFDLFIPPAPPHKESQEKMGWVNYRGSWYIKPKATVKIPLGIKLTRTGMIGFERMPQENYTQPYYVYPRSSIYKTPLRLANCTGIIDAGYRGELMAVFDNISDESYELKPYTRLLQACSPDLNPFSVAIVNKDFDMTTRGEGGLGSTGT